MDDYSDKWLVCNECGRQFLWDAGEQAWYHFKRFLNVPKRCRDCRDRKRNAHIQPAREMLASRG